MDNKISYASIVKHNLQPTFSMPMKKILIKKIKQKKIEIEDNEDEYYLNPNNREEINNSLPPSTKKKEKIIKTSTDGEWTTINKGISYQAVIRKMKKIKNKDNIKKE